MSNCKDCIHYEPCFEYGNILDPIHGGVKCDSFKSTADVVPKSEVERLNKKIDVLKRDRYQVFPDGRFELLPITDLDKIKAEVAREVAYDFQNRLRHIFLDMCNYNDYETLNLLQIDSAIEALYDTFSPELEKKYTEGAK